MARIEHVRGIEVLDSRGTPTIAVQITLDTGTTALAAVPSGASTGAHEAVEKRDTGSARYGGKGVLSLIQRLNTEISPSLRGMEIFDQTRLDERLLELDGTANKSNLGANTTLGVSLAAARAAAQELHQELYRYLGGLFPPTLPCPMLNILNGGAHAHNDLDFQEFMIRPHAAPSWKEALRWGTEVYLSLKKLLRIQGASTNVGDEGGFAPEVTSDRHALDLLVEAITTAGYRPGADISLALDCAASELYDTTSGRYVEKKRKARNEPYQARTTDEQIAYIAALVHEYPIDSIEDALDEEDWLGWKKLTCQLGSSVQLVGDDLFVTQQLFIERGIQEKSATAVLIKPNQVGTLSETIRSVVCAQHAGWRTVMSHRSGETEDTFIADLAVALGCGQIKMGAPCRGERTAKYNRLLVIEDALPTARYASF